MLDLFEQQLLVALQRPLIVPASATARMEFDAGLLPENGPGILIEAWAHQGPPEGAQVKKVVVDAFKLAFAASILPVRPRLVLLFCDVEAAAPFASPKSWATAAFEANGIESVVVDLRPEDRALIREAQAKQYRQAVRIAGGTAAGAATASIS